MKQSLIAGATCAAAVALLTGTLAGCSKDESKPTSETSAAATSSAASPAAPASSDAAAPNADHVTFGKTDAGPIKSVTCTTENALTTITVEANQQAVLEVTDEETPQVRSILIGEAGAEGPSLMFLEGVSEAPKVTRDGQRYTVAGTGKGAEASDPATPVDMAFDIAVSCP